MNTLVHDQRLQRKLYFSLRLDCFSFSNELLFLSLQIIQKMHKGVAHHAFFGFLLTKRSCHPKKVSLTEEESTHGKLKKEKQQLP